jgi:hypothetical protein
VRDRNSEQIKPKETNDEDKEISLIIIFWQVAGINYSPWRGDLMPPAILMR